MRGRGSALTSGSIVGVGMGVTDGVMDGDFDSNVMIVGLEAILEYFNLGRLMGALEERR